MGRDREYPGHEHIFACILWAIRNDREVVYYPKGNHFSLRVLDERDRQRFRQAILRSKTEIISLPGVDVFSCLCGDGRQECMIKTGMRYVPPEIFRRTMSEKDGRAALQYLVEAVVAPRQQMELV